MEYLQFFIHFLLHVDKYLLNFLLEYGSLIYILVFGVIFCETGLIFFPFLPGDSLLFTLGSISAHSFQALDIRILLPLLIVASYLGNYVNYKVGYRIGSGIASRNSPLFNQQHLNDAHAFYQKHGGKTIIYARFLPVIRTFVPFVAGMCAMTRNRFHLYNFISAVLWIGSLLLLGYFLGTLGIVQENLNIVIYSIILISFFPAFFTWFRSKYIHEKYQN